MPDPSQSAGEVILGEVIGVFGLLVAFASWLIWRWHRRNLVEHRDEVEGLLAIARSDSH